MLQFDCAGTRQLRRQLLGFEICPGDSLLQLVENQATNPVWDSVEDFWSESFFTLSIQLQNMKTSLLKKHFFQFQRLHVSRHAIHLRLQLGAKQIERYSTTCTKQQQQTVDARIADK